MNLGSAYNVLAIHLIKDIPWHHQVLGLLYQFPFYLCGCFMYILQRVCLQNIINLCIHVDNNHQPLSTQNLYLFCFILYALYIHSNAQYWLTQERESEEILQCVKGPRKSFRRQPVIECLRVETKYQHDPHFYFCSASSDYGALMKSFSF